MPETKPGPAQALTLSSMQPIDLRRRPIDLWLTASGWIWVCYLVFVAVSVSLVL